MSSSPSSVTTSENQQQQELSESTTNTKNLESSSTQNSKTSDENSQQQQPITPPMTTSSSSPSTDSSSSLFSSSFPMSPVKLTVICLISVVSTFEIISSSKRHPEIFTQKADLSAGQIMAFLVASSVFTTFIGCHLLALQEYFSPSPSFNKLAVGGAEDSTSSSVDDNNKDDDSKSSAPANIRTFSAAVSRVCPNEKTYNTLWAAFEFTSCLMLFFVCDRTNLLERTGKKYDRDFFWFLCFLLLMVGLMTLKKAAKPVSTSTKPKPQPEQQQQQQQNNNGIKDENNHTEMKEKNSATTTATTTVNVPSSSSIDENNNINEVYHVSHLQRDQTEEWKGWMQVMFLWYHYFNAKEQYNLIRLFIAAYVWMTGFGNFSYYYIRKDFSLLRFSHMQWRLNFLVFWVCLLMQNEYMLYYICMLHTTYTVFIYVGLGIKSDINQTLTGCWTKFILMTLAAVVIWDIPGMFEIAWAPFAPLVNFHNPYKKSEDPMHEWRFRSHLDHLVWIFGMLCAFFHPNVESGLKKLDVMPAVQQYTIKSIIVGISLVAAYIYYNSIFSLDKLQYNQYHPYTSFIPIAIFIVLRNISQIARMYHIHLFEWLGKITLETYISQYHIWMGTTGINGSPKKLLILLPKEYPLLNFVLFSALTLFVSFKLFNCTFILKSYFLPSNLQPEALRKELIVIGVVLACLYGASFMLLTMTGMNISTTL